MLLQQLSRPSWNNKKEKRKTTHKGKQRPMLLPKRKDRKRKKG
jgi:hypothetical protein